MTGSGSQVELQKPPGMTCSAPPGPQAGGACSKICSRLAEGKTEGTAVAKSGRRRFFYV